MEGEEAAGGAGSSGSSSSNSATTSSCFFGDAMLSTTMIGFTYLMGSLGATKCSSDGKDSIAVRRRLKSMSCADIFRP